MPPLATMRPYATTTNRPRYWPRGVSRPSATRGTQYMHMETDSPCRPAHDTSMDYGLRRIG
ncbi:hypothetical protein C8T65DRAFT_667658, partial [Cerioporus squamosus]